MLLGLDDVDPQQVTSFLVRSAFHVTDRRPFGPRHESARLALGPLYLGVAFGVPLALLGAAWNRYEANEREWAAGCAIAAVISAIFLIPALFNTRQACQDISEGIATETTLDILLGVERVTQNELDYVQLKCDEFPYA